MLLAILRSVLINARQVGVSTYTYKPGSLESNVMFILFCYFDFLQLLMTLFMTGTVIFIYTVIAFNFFRKFYRQEEVEGKVKDHCESMWRVSLPASLYVLV